MTKPTLDEIIDAAAKLPPGLDAWAGASDGPSFEEPCPERRGLVERRGAVLLHFCVECGRWGAYGYGATLSHPGRWYCRLHRPA
jgi:hypothetical protein